MKDSVTSYSKWQKMPGVNIINAKPWGATHFYIHSQDPRAHTQKNGKIVKRRET